MSRLLQTAAKDYLTKAPWLAQSDRAELVEDLRYFYDELRGSQKPYTYMYDDQVLDGILDFVESFFDRSRCTDSDSESQE